MNTEVVSYTTYSRRIGNMSKLVAYRGDLICFMSQVFPDQDLTWTSADIDYAISDGLVGAVLAFVSTTPIGVMTMYESMCGASEYGVGAAFVSADYRHKGVWHAMSKIVEAESRDSGALTLVRTHVPVLKSSLIRQGYVYRSPEELIKKLYYR